MVRVRLNFHPGSALILSISLSSNHISYIFAFSFLLFFSANPKLDFSLLQSHLLYFYFFLHLFFARRPFLKSYFCFLPIIYLLFPHHTLSFSNRWPHSTASTSSTL